MGNAKLNLNYKDNYNKCTLRNGDYLVLENIENSEEKFVCIFVYDLKALVCLDSGKCFVLKDRNINKKSDIFETLVGDVKVKILDIILQEYVTIDFNIGSFY